MRSVIFLLVIFAMLGLALPLLTQLNSRVLRPESGLREPAPGLISKSPGEKRPNRTAATGKAGEKTYTTTTIYRWRDSKGTLHIESAPPPRGVAAETLRLRTEVLSPPAGGAQSGQRTTARLGTGANQGKPAPGLTSPLSVYGPGGIDKLMQQLDLTLEGMDQRRKVMKELGKDL